MRNAELILVFPLIINIHLITCLFSSNTFYSKTILVWLLCLENLVRIQSGVLTFSELSWCSSAPLDLSNINGYLTQIQEYNSTYHLLYVPTNKDLYSDCLLASSWAVVELIYFTKIIFNIEQILLYELYIYIYIFYQLSFLT